jgi:hypothetical protein
MGYFGYFELCNLGYSLTFLGGKALKTRIFGKFWVTFLNAPL